MYFDTIRINDVDRYIRKGDVILIDLRSRDDYLAGHIPGAVNYSYDELMRQKWNLQQYGKLLLYCDRGNQSLQACRSLAREGFYAVNLSGGMKAYRGELASQ